MLNIGEGAGRVGPADKAHHFAIARGEAVEATVFPSPRLTLLGSINGVRVG
jgi:hypothetical protein